MATHEYTLPLPDVTLFFQSSLPLSHASAASSDPSSKACILLLHGFSGSSAYFARNTPALSQSAWVVAPDMRCHGRSGRSRGGFHVARLAADLRAIIAHLRTFVPEAKFVPVGCSIGAALLWTYVELFGCADFAGIVCVDQAPLQDRSAFGDEPWDETKCHRGCFGERTLLAAQKMWVETPEEAHRGLVGECLGYRFAPEAGDKVSEEERKSDEEFFMGVSKQADNVWLARLLADHTRYDHREACEGIECPTLVMAGRRTGCFPLEGMRETVKRVNKGQGRELARWSVFEEGHWLFWENAERFNREVGEFVKQCVRE